MQKQPVSVFSTSCKFDQFDPTYIRKTKRPTGRWQLSWQASSLIRVLLHPTRDGIQERNYSTDQYPYPRNGVTECIKHIAVASEPRFQFSQRLSLLRFASKNSRWSTCCTYRLVSRSRKSNPSISNQLGRSSIRPSCLVLVQSHYREFQHVHTSHTLLQLRPQIGRNGSLRNSSS